MTLTEQLWGSLLIAQVVKAARGAESEHKARKAVEQVIRTMYDDAPQCLMERPHDHMAGGPEGESHADYLRRVDAHESQAEWSRRMADLRGTR